MVKNLPANVRDARASGLIPVSGRSPEGGHGSSLQYSCLENPKDRVAWQAIVHTVAKSQTQLNQLNIQARMVLQATWIIHNPKSNLQSGKGAEVTPNSGGFQ